MIELIDVKKSFVKTEALRGVSYEFKSKEQYALCGPSGSGKSTILHLIGGLDNVSSGEILFDGKSIRNYNDKKLAEYRNKSVGLVFQFHFLLPSMKCIDNILLPAKIGGHNIKPVNEMALELAKVLGVEHCLKKYPFELSGGEQQRINIIRALSLRPKVILCDEPTGSLDSENSKLVTNILKELSKSFGSTLIVVTHDKQVSAEFSNVVNIQDGHLVQ